MLSSRLESGRSYEPYATVRYCTYSQFLGRLASLGFYWHPVKSDDANEVLDEATDMQPLGIAAGYSY